MTVNTVYVDKFQKKASSFYYSMHKIAYKMTDIRQPRVLYLEPLSYVQFQNSCRC